MTNSPSPLKSEVCGTEIRKVNPYSTPIERSAEDETSRADNVVVSNGTFDRTVIRYVDVVTGTFSIAMFGLAIPLNAYVMLEYSAAFNFRNPLLIAVVLNASFCGIFPSWFTRCLE